MIGESGDRKKAETFPLINTDDTDLNRKMGIKCPGDRIE
jgi:hypothetical protein